MASNPTRATPERLYRLLADNATDVVTLHDPTSLYRYVSPSVQSLLGYVPEELLGTPSADLVHPEDLPGIAEQIAALVGDEMLTLEYRMRHKDGHYEWLETIARRVGDEVQCSSRGIGDRRAAQAELTRRLAQQSAVARLGEAALQRHDIGALLDAAVATVAETLDVEIVSIMEHLGEGMVHVRAGCGWGEGFVGSRFEMSSFRDADGRAQYADGPVLIDDLPNNEAFRARPLREHGVVSSANVLIGSAAAPLAMLAANSRRVRAFDERDLDFLQAVAHVLAGAIERLRAERQMRHDALHDSLTGLPNRSLLLDRLHHALARATREGRRVALLFVDLDNLKVINDSLGHHAGDELLKAIGPRLDGQLRASDTVARFGGDEFAIVCEDIDDVEQAVEIARRVVAAFEDPFIVAGEERFGSVSVGVVVTNPAVPRSADELLSDADAAMYRAKERGRGRFELFDAGLRDRITARLQLEADLRRALEGESRLWVAYQPYYRLPGRRIAGVEALVRWEHPERGFVSPAEFIPVAEESGLVIPLGARVLRAGRAVAAGDRPRRPAPDRQRLRPPDGDSRLRRDRAGGAGRHRPAPRLARPRDHRATAARGDARHGADHRAAAGARRAAPARRLRHRLLVAALPAALSA
jgi:diguanylate cyclase (GGDEF)-like protein/PAS domain S-box-containing protein